MYLIEPIWQKETELRETSNASLFWKICVSEHINKKAEKMVWY